MNKVLPHDKTAERAILGAILLRKEVIRTVRGIVRAEDFFVAQHRFIYEAMISLDMTAAPIDAVTIADELRHAGKYYAIGDPKIFSDLTDDVVTTVLAEKHAEIVRACSARRKMIEAAHQVQVDGFNPEIDTVDYLNDARSRIGAAADKQLKKSRSMRVGELVDDAISEATSPGTPAGLVKTGIASIDDAFGGLWAGLVTVIAARPAMGKSATALNIAAKAAMAGKRVLFVSLEDAHRFVLYRLLSLFAKVSLDRIVNQRLSEEEKGSLASVRDIIACLPLTIEDASCMSSADIRMAAMSHADSSSLDLLIVDHLGHIRERGKDLYEQTTAAARNIAELAKELDIPVVLLHQLNRESLKRPGAVPTLGDLRQSGEVEQLARAVWLLHRPAYYDKTSDPHEMTLVVAKNSHGKTGNLKLRCDLSVMKITDDAQDRY